MEKYIIEIAYDGSKFEGYATQPHKNTVQDDLQKALKKIFKNEIKIDGSSRTDSKVHCLSQYVIFTAPFFIEVDRLMLALNINTRPELYIKKCQKNETNFHPRYNCVSKTYKYIILKKYDPFKVNYAFYEKQPLDVKKMQKAAKYFLGTHDFSSFCSSNGSAISKVRTINSLEINENSDEIVLTINGDGFLYNMVRIIVGTLVFVGLEKLKPEDIKEIILKKDRKYAGITSEPQGLFLDKIFYK